MGSKAHKPLAMSRDSMLAILAVPTRKTQTRRVIVPQPPAATIQCYQAGIYYRQGWVAEQPDGSLVARDSGILYSNGWQPRFKPGDGVYFREPLRATEATGGGTDLFAAYSCEDMLVWTNQSDAPEQHYCVPWRWKPKSLPGYLMPKRLSRACAIISEARVGRVQDISKDDAIAEGAQLKDFVLCKPICSYRTGWVAGDCKIAYGSPVDAYHGWWDSLNAKPRLKSRNPCTGEPEACYVGYPWDEARTERKLASGKMEYIVGNPFVWITGWTELVKGWEETQELIGKDAKCK